MSELSAGLVLYRRRPSDEPSSGPPSSRRGDEPAPPAGGTSGEPAPPRGAHHEPIPPAVEVLCGHMGGPFWARKDERAWSFPKGLVETGEGELDAALREFAEEVGVPAPAADYGRLGEYRYSSGKVVVLFAGELPAGTQLALDGARGATFELEWPPRSGHRQAFPEVDRVEWFDVATARGKLVAGQVAALDDLERLLAGE